MSPSRNEYIRALALKVYTTPAGSEACTRGALEASELSHDEFAAYVDELEILMKEENTAR